MRAAFDVGHPAAGQRHVRRPARTTRRRTPATTTRSSRGCCRSRAGRPISTSTCRSRRSGSPSTALRAHGDVQLRRRSSRPRATRSLRYLLRGENDPWMFHQANLRDLGGGQSLLTDLLDARAGQVRGARDVSRSSARRWTSCADRVKARMALDASGVSATIEPGGEADRAGDERGDGAGDRPVHARRRDLRGPADLVPASSPRASRSRCRSRTATRTSFGGDAAARTPGTDRGGNWPPPTGDRGGLPGGHDVGQLSTDAAAPTCRRAPTTGGCRGPAAGARAMPRAVARDLLAMALPAGGGAAAVRRAARCAPACPGRSIR